MGKTPRYVINLDKFIDNCMEIMTPFIREWGDNIEFGYSVKTNRDKRLIQYASSILQWNIEVVSPDEYHFCKSLGITDEQIIFNGPCKIEMFEKLRVLPKIINLDSYSEVVEFASRFSEYKGLVGLRVNFDLEKKCPGETTASEEVSRFGIDIDSQDFIKSVKLLIDNGITNIGLHMHTSTKTRSIKVFSELSKKAVELKRETNYKFSFVDMGGGFFGGQIKRDKPKMNEYAKAICTILKSEYNPYETRLILEPGASVVATCVSYETKVITKKIIRGVDVLTVDGSLLHINPFMFNRNQTFEVLNEQYDKRKKVSKQIIGAATCMENDRLATIYNQKELCVGDVLSFEFVGAYTMGFNSYFIIDPPHVDYLKENGK